MQDNTLVLTDRITENEVQIIPSGSRQQLETLARSIRALCASHNTDVPYAVALKTLQAAPVEDEWYLVTLDTIRSIRARTNIRFGLNQFSNTLRDTAPRLESTEQAQGAGGRSPS